MAASVQGLPLSCQLFALALFPLTLFYKLFFDAGSTLFRSGSIRSSVDTYTTWRKSLLCAPLCSGPCDRGSLWNSYYKTCKVFLLGSRNLDSESVGGHLAEKTYCTCRKISTSFVRGVFCLRALSMSSNSESERDRTRRRASWRKFHRACLKIEKH